MTSTDDDQVGRLALRKASWRLLPLIGLGYGAAYMDRVNISFASLQMNQDLHFSATVYGLGAGLFFLSYAALEVPSNLILAKVGARRWIARIMVTWGFLAMGMALVRTPAQFYVMRFLLGAAEAGFFPGVVYYLMQWFPAAERGRAISRFYIAAPLGGLVMGAAAGSLLGLQGRLGLAGWQWIFLVEGLPAVLLSGVFLRFLPDGPERAPWLSEAERAWISGRLSRERATIEPRPQNVLGAMLDPLVIRLGLANVLIMGGFYAFNLSAPAILKAATRASSGVVGYIVAGCSLLGVFSMLATGWHSDLRRERRLHLAAATGLLVVAFGAMAASATAAVTIGACMAVYVGVYAVQAVFWLLPSDELHGRSAAVGVAAIGSIGMIGAFAGPYAWGMAVDATGGFRAGQIVLSAAFAVVLGLVLSLRKPQAKVVGAAVSEGVA
jgi:ACS family tartrate transporter-like MFS transporter